jgi:hypothetical protein
LKLDTLVMIQTKFGFHWSSTFRGEDFWKSLRRTNTTAVPFSPLHIWIRILDVYVDKISRGRWPEHSSGKTPDEYVFIAYLCIHVNKVI